ncbi:MAG: nucleotidyltransferase domain-containing protein [Nanoarchaeota archaeon]|nr:nucleotidyltransferase domain-containing protein [Nanoarchaeota archaeon]
MPNTVINITNKLLKEDLIIKEKRKHLVEVYANVENEQFIFQKKLFNLSEINKSGIREFIKEKYSPKSISIIGSYSRGEDIETSDIDLVVITSSNKREDLEKFEKKLSRKIHLLLTNYKSISKEFYTNLINGITIQGYLEYETI